MKRMAYLKPIIIFLILICAGCATQPHPSASDPPGFLSGLVHGFLILFSFIGSIFTDIRIYAFPNTGLWYDLGYLIGAGLFLGGAGGSSSQSIRVVRFRGRRRVNV
jgi:hypothetical protein